MKSRKKRPLLLTATILSGASLFLLFQNCSDGSSQVTENLPFDSFSKSDNSSDDSIETQRTQGEFLLGDENGTPVLAIPEQSISRLFILTPLDGEKTFDVQFKCGEQGQTKYSVSKENFFDVQCFASDKKAFALVKIYKQSQVLAQKRFDLRIKDSSLPAVTAFVEGTHDTIHFKAQAQDESGIQSVWFYVDSAKTPFARAFLNSQNEFETLVDSKRLLNGIHKLTAKAFDQTGNHNVSDLVSFQVDNVLPEPPGGGSGGGGSGGGGSGGGGSGGATDCPYYFSFFGTSPRTANAGQLQSQCTQLDPSTSVISSSALDITPFAPGFSIPPQYQNFVLCSNEVSSSCKKRYVSSFTYAGPKPTPEKAAKYCRKDGKADVFHLTCSTWTMGPGIFQKCGMVCIDK